MGASILESIFGSSQPPDAETSLNQFATKGFLLIDTLPFAERYSNRRGRTGYGRLVESCSSFLSKKMDNGQIDWADVVQVALAFKLNGQAVMGSFPDGIRLPTGRNLSLSKKLIRADGSGYTSPKLLRSQFGLDGG